MGCGWGSFVSRGLTYCTSKQLFISDVASGKRTLLLEEDFGGGTYPCSGRKILKTSKYLAISAYSTKYGINGCAAVFKGCYFVMQTVSAAVKLH